MDRSLRLREEYEVREARARGKAYADGPVVARIHRPPEREGDPPRTANRYAVVAGKRVGKAVQRNRCKRLVREALRHLHPHLRQGYDIVVIVRGGTDELTGYDVAASSLQRIFLRAGLLPEPVLPLPLEPPPREQKP
jgi:ribonuclease P protein component